MPINDIYKFFPAIIYCNTLRRLFLENKSIFTSEFLISKSLKLKQAQRNIL